VLIWTRGRGIIKSAKRKRKRRRKRRREEELKICKIFSLFHCNLCGKIRLYNPPLRISVFFLSFFFLRKRFYGSPSELGVKFEIKM